MRKVYLYFFFLVTTRPNHHTKKRRHDNIRIKKTAIFFFINLIEIIQCVIVQPKSIFCGLDIDVDIV